MTAFAGVFLRSKLDSQSLDSCYADLKAALGLCAPAKPFDEIRVSGCGIHKWDVGAFDGRAMESEGIAVASALAGHPLIETLPGADRRHHLAFLMESARVGRFTDFSRARGAFSFVYADSRVPRLILATDALGIRPLYYADDGEKVVFSSTFSLFRHLDRKLTGGGDERAGVELAVFGFPLGDRTALRNVKCAPGGVVLEFDSTGVKRTDYWRTAALGLIQDATEADAHQAIWDAFNDAVSLRLSGQSVVMATLSGGMDSRAIVAALRQRGVGVNTLNFAPQRSQDLVYGRRIAAALGCNHTEVPIETGSVLDRTKLCVRTWQEHTNVARHPADRPNLVWSGDGGSVTLGHVYLSDGIVAAAAPGAYDRAIDLLLAENGWIVPRGILRKERVEEIAAYPKVGLVETLNAVFSGDPGRRLHMMLMATDQRRHMHPHFESIYEHECEVHLPFFDRRFIEQVLSRPAGPFLHHRFYNKWFRLFQPEVMAVPWQSYPGHEPCPVADLDNLRYQWTEEISREFRAKERSRYLRAVRNRLATMGFAGTAVSASRAALAWAATASRLRDLTHALRFSAIVSDAAELG
jgi:asparagine synthase (glutamine-hydrolysing)